MPDFGWRGHLLDGQRGYRTADVQSGWVYVGAAHGGHRKPFASSDWLWGTPAEIKAAFESYRAYYGTCEVDEKKGTITHHIEAGSFPNWYGLPLSFFTR
jgi:hypothetical protein